MTASKQPEHLEYQQLVNKIESGVTVISGNLRLSQSLHRSVEQKCLQAGLVVWETPDILPWDAWLRRSFKTVIKAEEESSFPTLLSDAQERLLWERVITDTDVGQSLLQISAAAKHCADAWRLIHQWQLSTSDIQSWHNDDSKVFLQWHDHFQRHCQQSGWLTMAQLPSVLGEFIQAKKIDLESKIILTGFDELTPQQTELLDVIERQSSQMTWIEKQAMPANAALVKLDQTRDEIDSAARWARLIIEENAAARVAIVVPELSAQRSIIQGIFDRVMMPVSLDPGIYDIQRPYNMSLGVPIIQTALVETAMLLLKSEREKWPIEALSVVVQSPYLGGWQLERDARSLLERKLREYARQEIPLTLVLSCAQETAKPYHCPLLASMLEAYSDQVSQLPSKASAKDWTMYYTAILASFAWGQGRSLSSEEYQTMEAWNELMRAFAQLDNVSSSVGYSQAYRYLLQSTHERIFQPHSADAPVQILGVMEAIGVQFDHLWVMGLHDGIWPAAARPNQFLPVAIQRSKMLPHSSAKRELDMASHITRRLLGSAANVICSYPANLGDELLRPSALLSELAVISLEQIPRWQGATWDQVIAHAAASETWHDPAIPVEDIKAVRGGSQIIKLQATCPFRAFAELRLGAQSLHDVTMGLAPSERGTLVHLVMENFWQRVDDHAQLINMDEALLKQVISDSVTRAIASLEQKRGEVINERFQQLEQLRLEKLVSEWLQIEKQRQPFSVIQAEQKIQLDIAGLNINLKIDRVDELEDGTRLVIDYKTGYVSPSQWFGERPEEPQLPLYSMIFPQQISGLVFAQLKPGESVFKGVTQDKNMLPGVRSYEQIPQAKEAASWDALLLQWRTTIEKLADDFRQGISHVDPLRYPGSCQYCSLGQLCRVAEQDNIVKDDGIES